MSEGNLNSPLVFVLLLFLFYCSEKSQEILKNLNKALEEYLGRDSPLEKIKVCSHDLLICGKTGTALVLKLDIDFITLWDDPMQGGSATIINIFELFKQTKNCADSDNCRESERRIFCNTTLLG